MYKIVEANNKKQLKQFIDFEYFLYKDDGNYIAPLKNRFLKLLQGKNNPLFMSGEHKFFLLEKNNKICARILVGIDENLNEKKNKKEGYFSLFECIKDKKAAYKILDHATLYLKEKGMDTMVGPVSFANSDERKGFLIKGFDGSPVFLNSYNPKYYIDYITEYGLKKSRDMYAYFFDASNVPITRYKRVVEYAMKKYKFKLDKFDFNNLEKEIMDMKIILEKSMPDSWQHLTAPSYEELKAEVDDLKPIADKEILYIARNFDKEPIGIVIAVPDFNQVFKKLNGKIGLGGLFKLIYYKRKINGMRIFAQFVVPEYRNKAVNSSIFYKLMVKARENGYDWAEGSTIAEMNKESIRSVENAGGKRYRVYRIYKKKL